MSPLWALLLLIQPGEEAFTSEDCSMCHEVSLVGSVHEGEECTSCHTGIQDLPHDTPLPRVQCGICHEEIGDFYRFDPHGRARAAGDTRAPGCTDCHGTHEIRPPDAPGSPLRLESRMAFCATCHERIGGPERYHIPAYPPDSCLVCHGQKGTGAAFVEISALNGSVHAELYCTDCYAEHRILPPDNPESPVYPFNVPKTCGSCHENYVLSERYGIPGLRLSTYLESFHGIALQGGRITAANCVSCHEHHRVLPASDPASPVNPANLSKTCGQCHPGIRVQPGEEFVVHRVVGASFGDRLTELVRVLYLWLIGLTIGGMLFYVGSDWLYKLRHPEARIPYVEENPHKFNRTERALHLVHLITFFLLAYTGFAHRYPETALTAWIVRIADGTVRAYLHRGAGVVLLLVFLLQGALALFTARGRAQIRALLPRFRDVADALKILGRNLGLRKEAAVIRGFTFYEKFEYWAFIWGSGIMGITGLLLWFTSQTLSLFPKWVLDVSAVIHFYEAILATLAILVWHLYWVVFDPAVYPLNWTMFRGELSRKQEV